MLEGGRPAFLQRPYLKSPATSSDNRVMALTQRRLHFTGATLALLCFAFGIGCFEDPVSQTVEVEFLDAERAIVRTRVELNWGVTRDNRFAVDRLRSMSHLLLETRDEWSHRYAAVDAEQETYTWTKSAGELDLVERTARLDLDNVSRFFADTSISVFITGGDGWAELSIFPGTSNRATREQRKFIEDKLDLWTKRLEQYLRETDRLYRYLQRSPDRAAPVFAAIFENFIPAESLGGLPELTEDEIALVDEVDAVMERAADVLVVQDDEAFTINEVSYLVFDPFPANMAVKVPGTMLEMTGFEIDEEKRLVIQRTGLWEALDDMQGLWVSPDPLTTWVDLMRSDRRFDLEQWLAMERSVGTIPDRDGIRLELERRLAPEEVYRIRWRTQG